MEELIKKLQEFLSSGEERLSGPLLRLAQAIWGNPEDVGVSHDEVLATLPQLVEDELEGDNIVEKYPLVKSHLDGCENCSRIYAELLDTAWREARGGLDQVPPPDE